MFAANGCILVFLLTLYGAGAARLTASGRGPLPGLNETCTGTDWPQVFSRCADISVRTFTKKNEVVLQAVTPRCYKSDTGLSLSWDLWVIIVS